MTLRFRRAAVVPAALFLVLALAAGAVVAAPLVVRKQLAEDCSVTRQARELLDVLYPGSPPPDADVELMRTVVLAFELERVRAAMAGGSFERAGSILAEAVHGVSWRYSVMEFFQALDGFVPPSEKDVPGDAAAARDVADLRQDYRVDRSRSFRSLLDGGGALTFAETHAWVTEGGSALERFVTAREGLVLPWDVLARSEVASLPSLLVGAREAEQASSAVSSSRRNLTMGYLRANLERWVVFAELVHAASVFKDRFRAFVAASRLTCPVRILAIETGSPVAEGIVSFSNGALGTTKTDAEGRAVLDLGLDRLSRLVGGDGWVPLSVFVGRREMLFTNLNLNSLLQSTAPVVANGGCVVRVPEIVYRVTRPAATVRVTVTCDLPDGILGTVSRVLVTLSGHKPVETTVGGTVEFRDVVGGLYLVSAEAKDAEGVTIKTSARSALVDPSASATMALALTLPRSATTTPQGVGSVDALVKALTDNKDRLLRNELEVKEYREAQGSIFRDNRAAAGKEMRQVMASFAKISVGLKYKSEGLGTVDRIAGLEKRMVDLRTSLPGRIAREGELRTNLLSMVEQYSSENFDLGGDDEYLFRVRAQELFERSQANQQELAQIFEILDGVVRPGFQAIVADLTKLMGEYADQYQLVKFTVGLSHDADLHRLVETQILPFRRLLDEVQSLKANRFLDSYSRQVTELGRVVANRDAEVKVTFANLERGLQTYREHVERKLEPLRQRLAELSAAGFSLGRMARLLDVVPFGESGRRVVDKQQGQFFALLDEAAAEPGLAAVGSPPSVQGLQGRVPRDLAILSPALDLFARVDRNQAEGRRLLKAYDQELRTNLLLVLDVTVPVAEMRDILAKERPQRRAELNARAGEVSQARRGDDKLLLAGVPDGGENLLRAACSMVGLYVHETEARRARDGRVAAALDKVEPSVVALAEGREGTDPAVVAHTLGILAAELKPPKQGGLAFPRLDSQTGPGVQPRVDALKARLEDVVARQFREPRAACERLAARLNPATLVDSPPEDVLAQARSEIARPEPPGLAKLIEAMRSLGLEPGRAYDDWKASRARLEEYLSQVGGL